MRGNVIAPLAKLQSDNFVHSEVLKYVLSGRRDKAEEVDQRAEKITRPYWI